MISSTSATTARAADELADPVPAPLEPAPIILKSPVGESPRVAPWPRILPPVIRAPCGACYPGSHARELRRRLQALEQFPAACQGAIDAVYLVGKVRLENADALCQTATRLAEATTRAMFANQWSTWEVVVLGLAIGVGAAAVGSVVGFLAAK